LTPAVAANVSVGPLPHPVRPPVKLSSLQPGEAGRVRALRCEGFNRRRLLDLGLTPGTVVECAYPGPMGEPTAYLIRGALIALRSEQGDEIEIEPLAVARAEERR
jgi:ferrous iron transport protein A